MQAFAGLDFGTTNSAIAVNINGKIQLINIDNDIDGSPITTLKSVLFFSNQLRKIFFGNQAIEMYIEEAADGRFLRSVKTLLATERELKTAALGKSYEISDLVALIISEIKKRAELKIQRQLTDVVLGRPVVFSSDSAQDKLAEDRLRKAANDAGFHNIAFQYEPIAAALQYEATLKEDEEKIVLVGDFGGGTSDFTIIRLSGKLSKADRKDDILGLGGLYIGGDTFDSILMWNSVAKHFGKDAKFRPQMSDKDLDMPLSIVNKLRNWHLIHQLRNAEVRTFLREAMSNSDSPDEIMNLKSLIDDNLGILLFRAIEKAKCQLTFDNEVTIYFDEMFRVIQEKIAKIRLEGLIEDKIEELADCIDQIIIQAGMPVSKIDAVLLTGGTSQIPKIRQVFIRKFGDDKIIQTDLFTSVAQGLASCDY